VFTEEFFVESNSGEKIRIDALIWREWEYHENRCY